MCITQVRNLNILFPIYVKNMLTNKRDAVNMLHNICDKRSLIKCELVAYALDQIVFHVTRIKKCEY